MRKILLILPFSPYPLSSGGHQAIFNGIKAVCDNVKVCVTFQQCVDNFKKEDVVNFSKALKDTVTVLPYVYEPEKKHYEELKLSKWQIKLHNKYWQLGEKYPWLVNTFKIKERYQQPEYRNWLNELRPLRDGFIEHILQIINDYNIDVVQSEMLSNLALVKSLPASVRKVFVHHEIGFVRQALRLSSIGDKTQEGKAYLELYKDLEVNLLNNYDNIITLSSIDTEKLKKAGVLKPIHTSFAIVETSNISAFKKEDYSFSLSFVGPEMHNPNYKGLQWFLDNCWQQILERDAHYSLRIIGRWSEKTQKEWSFKYKNIQFLGFVPDLASAIRDTIMIVPITIGSGIRMKILEACSIGVPFVSTSIGAEGIPVVNGESCFIADDPKIFVKCIQELSNEQIREKFVKKAHELVCSNYSIDALRRNRLEIFDNL